MNFMKWRIVGTNGLMSDANGWWGIGYEVLGIRYGVLGIGY